MDHRGDVLRPLVNHLTLQTASDHVDHGQGGGPTGNGHQDPITGAEHLLLADRRAELVAAVLQQTVRAEDVHLLQQHSALSIVALPALALEAAETKKMLE